MELQSLKNLVRLPITSWQKIGEYFAKKIKADALAGKFQNDQSGFSYSSGYARMKAKSFRNKEGKRDKRYPSVSLNTDTTKVTMHLTGNLMQSLKVKDATETSVTIAYDINQDEKAIWNKRHGYDVTTLSTENQKEAVKLVKAALAKELRDKRGGKQVIKI